MQPVIASVLCIPRACVRPELTGPDLPNWDSLRHLILVMEIERTFECRFDLEEIAKLDSVEKLVSAVVKA